MPKFATIVANHALGISKHHRCRPLIAWIAILRNILKINPWLHSFTYILNIPTKVTITQISTKVIPLISTLFVPS
jgi:hypothetical protein